MVALKLHIVHLHVEVHVGHYLARADKGGALLLQRLGPPVDVGVLGTAEELLDVLRFGIDAMLAHLQAAKLARQAHDAHIVARLSLHGHHIAFGDFQAVGEAVEFLVVVLEPHLHTVKGAVAGLADTGHPVGRRHLRAAAALARAHGLVALGLAAAAAGQEFGLFILHPRNLGVGLQVGVELALLAVVFLHLGVLPLHLLLLLLRLAAVLHEIGKVLGRCYGLLLVNDDIVREFLLHDLDVLFRNNLFLVFLFFHF